MSVVGAGVEFPEIRGRLSAVAGSLRDESFQDRLWRRGERLNNEELGFDDTILLVIDELDWPEPHDLVGSVLRDEVELEAFRRPSEALRDLIVVIGKRGTYDEALASGAPWQAVLVASGSLIAALNR
jgi:hypothetical protein